MAYKNHDKFWRPYFYSNVFAKDRVQDINLNQLELKVNDSYKKDEKISTNFEPFDDSDVINEAYLDKNLSKKEGHISYFEKCYNDFTLLCYKQCVEEVLIQSAVKTTIQIYYDWKFFDNYDNADEFLKIFLFLERLRPNLEEVNDVLQ